jgi:Ca2+:H+ antiporter
LFGVGMAMIFGGYKRPLQSFDGDMVSINGSLLTLAAFGLVVPAVFHFSNQVNQEISLEISVILLVIYFASLVFTLTTAGRPHAVQCGIVPVPETKELEREIHEVEEALPDWSRSKALLILGAVAVALAFTSDLLTDSIQPASSALGLSPSFAGIFLLAMVGNVPQYMNSVSFAAKNRMTTQLVLLVAPILVIAGTLMGIPMDLLFSYFELVAILLSVIITRSLISDNTSNWLEGVMLVGVYVMLAVGFYYAPN